MEDMSVGDLVTVASGGPVLDGIVFDLPSKGRVVVAVVDPSRGPSFRTVGPETLSGREAEGADDRAIAMLIRRTPPPRRGTTNASTGKQGRGGHNRSAPHRSNG